MQEPKPRERGTPARYRLRRGARRKRHRSGALHDAPRGLETHAVKVKLPLRVNPHMLRKTAMPKVYLDHQASTPVLPEVVEAMRPWFSEAYGSPSSLHQHGLRARDALQRRASKSRR